MKKEVSSLWVAALLSGNYKPGKNMLQSVDKEFCPLGVLAELAISQGKKVVRELDRNGYMYNGFRYQLPEEVVQWAELKNPHGFCLNLGRSVIWYTEQGKSFAEIAAMIEKDWKHF